LGNYVWLECEKIFLYRRNGKWCFPVFGAAAGKNKSRDDICHDAVPGYEDCGEEGAWVGVLENQPAKRIPSRRQVWPTALMIWAVQLE